MKQIEMFYDEYEYHYGDGMFPIVFQTKDTFHFKKDTFHFIFDPKTSAWNQHKEHLVISGLDGDNGVKLLEILGKGKAIYNSYGRCIFHTTL